MAGDRVTSDEIARLAVRALAGGRADSVDDAIDRAVFESRADPRTQRPTRAQLRAHAQALEESEGGELARLLRIEATLREALSVLSTLEETLIVHDRDFADHAAPAVYGRAARGEFDLDPAVQARVVTSVPAHVLAQALTDAGFGETEVRAIDTRYGHLDEISFATELALHRIVRVPPRAPVDPRTDLVRGQPIESADFEGLLRRMPRFGITDRRIRQADSPFPPPR
ncbi:MAG: hypothetical protein RLZZ116_912 [Planctomycetota bacterium]|jgi:hypothetical protein